MAAATLTGLVLATIPLALYFRDKRLNETAFQQNQKRNATSGILSNSQPGTFEYISVGATRFIVASSDGVFLRDDSKPVLSIHVTGGKLLVSTSIRNKNGELIAELRDNEWTLNRDAYFDRNYTDQALEVRDRLGKVALQIVHFGDTVHVAGIFRCRNGWTTVLGPVGNAGAVMDIKPPGAEPEYQIQPIFEYPSDLHFGQCPGIESLGELVSQGNGTGYMLGGSLDLCNKAAK